MSIDQLGLLHLLTPSLVHLDVKTNRQVSFNFLQRFSQWEIFLCQKLRLLEKFKFVINICEYQFESIESILTAFRTPFWLDDKRWFITCQLIADNVSNSGLILYSSEGTWTEFPFNTRESILSYFTFTRKDDNAANMSSKWYVRSDLARMVTVYQQAIFKLVRQISSQFNDRQMNIDLPRTTTTGACIPTTVQFEEVHEMLNILAGGIEALVNNKQRLSNESFQMQITLKILEEESSKLK
ncbi:unnamed protein product [Rotaria sordida]|uniref:Uncharacterized protein n=2 Tax=Rotaria sordida TaxID=392033 RepID=A0A815X1E8_9BILA|nr:unnamed protein product [Rotaria sordida]CAF1549239.1 unnamed protein product [Rotaria sordida]